MVTSKHAILTSLSIWLAVLGFSFAHFQLGFIILNIFIYIYVYFCKHCCSQHVWSAHLWSAESEGLRFDSSELFLCPCSWQDEKTFSGANGLIVTDPCGSNSSADSEMTAFDGRIVHNRINGFTICHGIFRTGFVRTPLPEFSTH